MNYCIRSTGQRNLNLLLEKDKTKMLLRSFTILLLLFSQQVNGQQNTASMDFFKNSSECKGTLGGWKCLELDLSSEASMENDTTKVYEYSWNLGDGNRRQNARR